ncbi:hypothetical protein A2U01_0058651 [Trifolium medium]|uniref:Uncharacterized protein n=1 Tax=Trifolium medium TaxID=97028 RepID=A0A392RMB9_9FABA|nr:hypothetical protein [Trifolium medium]
MILRHAPETDLPRPISVQTHATRQHSPRHAPTTEAFTNSLPQYGAARHSLCTARSQLNLLHSFFKIMRHAPVPLRHA